MSDATPGQAKGKAGKKNTHGGRRAFAGRKKAAATVLRDELNRQAVDLIYEHLPRLVANLQYLADGGFEEVENEYEPQTIVTKDPVTGESKAKIVKTLVKQKVHVAAPDRAANQYLIDRVLGRPKQGLEHSGPNGEPLSAATERLIDKIYGMELTTTTETHR